MNIVVTGLQRSGSTLTWQIVKEISNIRPNLNINLSKIHGGANVANYDVIIATYRDMRDIILSYVNSLFKVPKHNNKSIEQKINMAVSEIEPYFKSFKNLYDSKSDKIILIRYEDFLPEKNEKLIKFIFDKIKIDSDFLTEIELKNISDKLSIDSNKKMSKKFKNFNDYDKVSLIHGNHITSEGKSKNWDRETFNENIVKRIAPMLEKLNYM